MTNISCISPLSLSKHMGLATPDAAQSPHWAASQVSSSSSSQSSSNVSARVVMSKCEPAAAAGRTAKSGTLSQDSGNNAEPVSRMAPSVVASPVAGALPSQVPSLPLHDKVVTTVLQTAPATPQVSRAALPVSYDRRAWLLLLRMVVAIISFAVVGSWLVIHVMAMVGMTRLLVLLGAAETAFFLYYRRKYELLNAQPLRHAPAHHDALAAFNRLIQVCRFFQHKIDARVYLSTWFCGADYRLIRRDNVADLIAYGFWYMSRAEMEAAGLGPLLRQCVGALESAFQIHLPPGHQRGLHCMFHLWEPLRTIYRPLLFYIGTEVLALLTKVILLALGCNLHTDPVTGLMVVTAGLDEHLRDHRSWSRRRCGSFENHCTNTNSNSVSDTNCNLAESISVLDGVKKAAGVGGGDGGATGGGGLGGAKAMSSDTGLNERPTVMVHWDAEPDLMEASDGGAGYVRTNGCRAVGRDGGDKPGAAGHGTSGGDAASGPPVTPVLLLHGVGLGLLPYTNFIRCLLAAGMPLVAVEYKHVSMRLCSIIPSADDIAAGAVGLMDRLGLEQTCVVAHSYGTFVASRMAQMYAHRMQSLALLDPVCFGMFMPHLLANFIYRQPRTTSLDIWIKDMLFKFVSRDLHCAAALCRRFYWSDVNLWPQDIPGRTLVAIGGQDQLIHVDEVLDFIQHYAAKILYHPDHSHAQLMMDQNWQQQVISDVLAMASSGGGVAGAREVERRLTSMPAKGLAAHPTPPLEGEEGLSTSLAEAVATAAPGVVRRVTTQRQLLMAPPPSSSLAAQPLQEHQTPPPGAANSAAATENNDDQEDVAALAAALSQKIGQARQRERTADMPLPPPPLSSLPSPSSSSVAAAAAAEISAPEAHAVDAARRSGTGVVPHLRRMPPPVVPRRCTAAARLQHVSNATGQDRLLHMELAGAGLNHAVLITPPPPPSPPPPPMPKAKGAPTISFGGVSTVSPCGVLRPVLPSICETREDASGPSTPAWDAAPLPSAFPPFRQAARETLIKGAACCYDGATQTRRTWTT